MNRNEPAPSRVLRASPAGRALALGAGLLALGALLASGIFRCPMAALLHVPCPACGSTRAARALLSLDLSAAFHFNPAAPFVIAALAGLAWRALALVLRHGDARRIDEEPLGRAFLGALAVAMIAQLAIWVARFFGAFGGPCPI